MLKRYVFIKQSDLKDCGVACLLMIIMTYGGYITKEKLRILTTTTKSGTTAYHLIMAANKIGFNACGVKGSINELNQAKIIVPCIAHVVLNKSYYHYVVIYQINSKRKQITIADPSYGIKKVSFAEFNKIWTGVLIILYPVKPMPKMMPQQSLGRFFYTLLFTYRKELSLVFILSLFVAIFNIINSFQLKILIDQIIISNSLSNLSLILIVFFLLMMIKCVTDLFRKNLLIFINQKMDVTIFNHLFQHIIRLPYLYYRTRTTGEITSRLQDLNYVKEMMSKLFLTLFIDTVLVLLAGVVLYLINSTLFIISILFILGYLLVMFIFYPLLEHLVKKHKQQEAMISSYLIESITSFETIKGLKMERNISSQMENKYHHYLTTIRKFGMMHNTQTFLKDILNGGSMLIIMGLGITMVINQKLTLGTLLTYHALLIYFLEPIKNIIDLEPMIRYVKVSLTRMLELYDVECEKLSLTYLPEPKPIKGKISLRKLTFSYNPKTLVLNNVNITIEPGDKVLIVGASGQGKSTLLKLLMRYYDVNNNSIYLDDIDINNYKLDYLRDNLCYVPQTATLFTDSIYNNIVLNRDCQYNQFIKMAKALYIDEIYKDNPLTYEMLIEENGFNISGGEKQRIILARTFLSKASVYLLDESFNELNVEWERKLLINIFKMLSQSTLLLVSHRLDNKDLFDQILYLKQGTIIKREIKNKMGDYIVLGS
ncbi:MAG: peptidase domain-containing ABC transporter [Bacilli bacterium]|nr:peptidase domain-containing ABC transporter [Bacilli bacterium]